MKGRTLGPYRLLREIGAGGMGTVFLAEDTRPEAEGDRRVAVKIVHPHLLSRPGFFKRFLREAEIGRCVDHPNLVRTLDADAMEFEGRVAHYLVTEFVEGQTLRALFEEMGTLPEELCRHVAREISRALVAVHAAGVVHRDLKPENVMVTPDHAVRVMDLGVARLQEESIRLSRSGEFVGSVLYAAPEQFRGGEGDGRADLYSLGLVLYELATGKHPSGGEELARIVERRLGADLRPAGDIDPRLSPFFEELVHVLLAREPDGRFSSAGDLLTALEEGEESDWWRRRSAEIRVDQRRSRRRVRIPRDTGLYGREDEIALLETLLGRADSGRGQVLLLEGEAGIGKTRLVDEFATDRRRRGADLQYLFGGYSPCGAATVAGAFSTAFREHFGPEGLETDLPRFLADLSVLVPAFVARLRGEPPPEGHEALTLESLQTVFIRLTQALAADRPTVLLIDDLHFAPAEGRALFAALALAVPSHRIVLVGTFRPGLAPDWLAGLERFDHVSKAVLDRLDEDGLSRVLHEALGRLSTGSVGRRVAAMADGNPYFAFEIIRTLRESLRITRSEDGAWVTTEAIEKIDIPSSVQDLIESRISGLLAEEREVLDAAACCGFTFEPGLVADALGLARIPVLRSLAHIESVHRLVRSVGPTYVFDHHQVHEVLYTRLAQPLRQEYHTALGEVLATRHPEPVREAAYTLCGHFLSGGRPERIQPYLTPALDHLESSCLGDALVRLTELALAAGEQIPDRTRFDVLLRRSRALENLGRWDEQGAAIDELLPLADRLDDGALRLAARWEVAHHRWLRADYDAALAETRTARDLAREIGDRRQESLCEGLLGNIETRLGNFGKACEHFERHLETARELGDRRGEAAATGNLGGALDDLGRHEEALRLAERQVAIYRDLSDRQGQSESHANLGLALINLGRLDEARDHQEKSRSFAREIGNRRSEAMAEGNLGVIESKLGRWAEAADRYRSVLAALREMGDRLGEAIGHLNLGNVGALLGEIEAAREHGEAGLALARDIGARGLEGHALGQLGTLAEWRGDLDEAVGLLEEAHASFLETGQDVGAAGLLVDRARVEADLGREESATTLLEEALAVARESGDVQLLVFASAARAVLPGGNATEALEALPAFEEKADVGSVIRARFALWKATGDREHLETANRHLTRVRDLTPPEFREAMFENVPPHRQIRDAGIEQS